MNKRELLIGTGAVAVAVAVAGAALIGNAKPHPFDLVFDEAGRGRFINTETGEDVQVRVIDYPDAIEGGPHSAWVETETGTVLRWFSEKVDVLLVT